MFDVMLIAAFLCFLVKAIKVSMQDSRLAQRGIQYSNRTIMRWVALDDALSFFFIIVCVLAMNHIIKETPNLINTPSTFDIAFMVIMAGLLFGQAIMEIQIRERNKKG